MRIPLLFGVCALLLFALTGYALVDIWRQEMTLRRIGETRKSFEAAVNELDTTVLLSRAGLLRNYDAIVAASDRAMAALREIDALDTDMPALAGAVEAARKQQEEKQDLIEQFKSENALLQNSLVYFTALGKDLQQTGDGALSNTVSALAAVMLAFTLNPSDDNAAPLTASISRLATQAIDPSHMKSRDSLAAHAQLIQSTLAGVDQLVQSVLTRARSDGVSDAVAAAEIRHTSLTRAYLVAFSIATVLAASACIAIGFQLRTKIRTIRARKELDTIVADMTLHSINASTVQLNAIVQETLRRLAVWAGADRARYVSAGMRRMSYDSMPGSSQGSCAALEAFALADNGRDFIYVRRGRAVEDAALSRALAGVDVATWVCYRSGDTRRGSLLTLECQRGGFHYGEEVLNLLRGPLDAISDAIDRVIQKAEQRALEARLNQAQRLEAVGTFASGIAHNLNNITAAIRGHAEMAGETQHRQTLDRHIREILKGADRAHDVVSEIMAFGRSDASARKSADLSALVGETLRLLSPSVPASVRLEPDIAAGVTASIDARQIEQVLLNLIRNAWQAIGEGRGVVRVRLETREQAGAMILSHGTAEPGRYTVLTVADNGEGMDETAQDRLFEPFFSTREGGNGLGLATVKRIVADHRGALDMESTLGRGSTIRVWLPVDAANPADGAIPEAEGTGERILLVGRNKAERLKMEETVAALGYEPVGFSDPDLAVGTLPAFAFDAVLLLTRRNHAGEYRDLLKAIGRDLPVVIVGPPETVPQVVDAAAMVDVVHRPITPSALAAALARAIQQRASLKTPEMPPA